MDTLSQLRHRSKPEKEHVSANSEQFMLCSNGGSVTVSRRDDNGLHEGSATKCHGDQETNTLLSQTNGFSQTNGIKYSEDKLLQKTNASVLCHQAADSLFSTTSHFTDYRGILNWCFLLLTLSTGRAALENVIHYGVLIDPFAWFSVFLNRPFNCPSVLVVLSLNMFILTALLIEKLRWQNILSESATFCLHTFLLLSEVMLPAGVILYLHPNPIASSLSLGVVVIVFLKLVSYVHVNSWCRNSVVQAGKKSKEKLVKYYQARLNVKDMYYFICAPTLCYDFNFPRSARIHKRFLAKRLVELVFLPALILSLVQQWIIPIINQSRSSFQQKDLSGLVHSLLHLTLPNHFIWLMWFYWFFHSALNVAAELLRFGDRTFYLDWWNAETVQYFWQTWNIPVHKWALRHLYQPLRQRGFSKNFANVSVFLVSAFFHEYLISVPLCMFRLWAFSGMLAQVPLSWLTSHYFNGKTGNLVVWATVIILQPVGILMYYHDYYVLNA